MKLIFGDVNPKTLNTDNRTVTKSDTMKKNVFKWMGVAALVALYACGGAGQKEKKQESAFTGAAGEVKLLVLDPGHFHAGLVQKRMYKQISPDVHVFAPEGSDVQAYLAQMEGYNSRPENPTTWNEIVYTGPDFLQKMLAEKPGNVVVLSGNNQAKTEYISQSVSAGLNVLADKPMVISPEKFPELESAFKKAEEKGVLLYDIMTERYEVTTRLQKELSRLPDIFGELQTGTPDEPAVVEESVHHFYKTVSGKPVQRPAWFFDVEQQGEGLVDVGTHLVDLVQWTCFPNQALQKADVQILKASHWSTQVTTDEFEKVTGIADFPSYLDKYIVENQLEVMANGEMTYQLKGVNARVKVEWNYEAPEGGGDTHYSFMRGKLCDLVIRQGKEENYLPTLYVEAHSEVDLGTFTGNLEKAVIQDMPITGLSLEKTGDRAWKVVIPEQYRVGHEAHFAQVTEKYLQYLVKGKMPSWEVPNMITKYYTTTEGLRMARRIE
ncbi:oxidoreductase [Prolixibacter bellariivorans]|uniref:Oxidoreductase n=2 Tax=Prolixibacter bellariivorans TaxID=314319 RepID=A0A5M4B233_9BACT|nr:oxidoreductase [Prolixibacter bellariivorans]